MIENTKRPAFRGAWQIENILMKMSSKYERGTEASTGYFRDSEMIVISVLTVVSVACDHAKQTCRCFVALYMYTNTYKSLPLLVENNQRVAKDTSLSRTSEWSSLVNIILPYYQFIQLNTIE